MGTWNTSGSTGYNGGTYRYTNNGDSTRRATWTANLNAGNYEVFVFYRAGSNRCTSTKYVISAKDGSQTKYVNQQINSLTWVSVGTFEFNAGANTITLYSEGSSGGGGIIISWTG